MLTELEWGTAVIHHIQRRKRSLRSCHQSPSSMIYLVSEGVRRTAFGERSELLVECFFIIYQSINQSINQSPRTLTNPYESSNLGHLPTTFEERKLIIFLNEF